jgi:exosome complex component RRP41
MSKIEFISPEGLRVDGRRPQEVRKINFRLNLFSRADGSAYYEQGNTRVLAAVYGPRQVTHHSLAKHDRAIINCEYSMATFSTGERRKTVKRDRYEYSKTINRVDDQQKYRSLFVKHSSL